MTPEETRDRVVEVVDQSALALGGQWAVYSGPAAEGCHKRDAGDGVAYDYSVVRDSGDPQQDVDALVRLWKTLGIDVHRFPSAGPQSTLGVRGFGGPLTSIEFTADVRGYTIGGFSACVEGNAGVLQTIPYDGPALRWPLLPEGQ